MDDCIFCKIATGKAESLKIHENKDFVAFLDIRPFRLGHTLSIPKRHYEWVYDVPNFGEYFEFVREVIAAQLKAFDADSVSISTVGHDIPHAHVHTLPRIGDDKGFVRESNVERLDAAQMKEIAEKIRKHI